MILTNARLAKFEKVSSRIILGRQLEEKISPAVSKSR